MVAGAVSTIYAATVDGFGSPDTAHHEFRALCTDPSSGAVYALDWEGYRGYQLIGGGVARQIYLNNQDPMWQGKACAVAPSGQIIMAADQICNLVRVDPSTGLGTKLLMDNGNGCLDPTATGQWQTATGAAADGVGTAASATHISCVFVRPSDSMIFFCDTGSGTLRTYAVNQTVSTLVTGLPNIGSAAFDHTYANIYIIYNSGTSFAVYNVAGATLTPQTLTPDILAVDDPNWPHFGGVKANVGFDPSGQGYITTATGVCSVYTFALPPPPSPPSPPPPPLWITTLFAGQARGWSRGGARWLTSPPLLRPGTRTTTTAAHSLGPTSPPSTSCLWPGRATARSSWVRRLLRRRAVVVLTPVLQASVNTCGRWRPASCRRLRPEALPFLSFAGCAVIQAPTTSTLWTIRTAPCTSCTVEVQCVQLEATARISRARTAW